MEIYVKQDVRHIQICHIQIFSHLQIFSSQSEKTETEVIFEE